jgi:hypothetical protein
MQKAGVSRLFVFHLPAIADADVNRPRQRRMFGAHKRQKPARGGLLRL